jgi:hypothetical protein
VHQLKTPDFPAMRRRHARAQRGHRNAAAALLAGGLLLATAGMWLRGAPPLMLLVPGLMAAALAVLPLAAMIERRERIEGLRFLEEEWRGSAAAGAAETCQELVALIGRLYRRSGHG